MIASYWIADGASNTADLKRLFQTGRQIPRDQNGSKYINITYLHLLSFIGFTDSLKLHRYVSLLLYSSCEAAYFIIHFTYLYTLHPARVKSYYYKRVIPNGVSIPPGQKVCISSLVEKQLASTLYTRCGPNHTTIQTGGVKSHRVKTVPNTYSHL